jgi:hypothetical protein
VSDLFVGLYALSLIAMVVAIVKRKTISKSILAFAVVLPTILFIAVGVTMPPEVDKGIILETTVKEIKTASEKLENKSKSPIDIFKEKVESKLDKNVKVKESSDKSCVMVDFPISDNLWSDSRVRGAQRDVVAILAEYKDIVWNKNAAVCITGTFPAVDVYGNINKNEAAMMLTIEYKTLMKMNLGNIANNPALLDNSDLYSYILFPYMRG